MIRIICLGKIKENYLADAIADYLKRISKYHKIEIVELKDDENPKDEENQIMRHIDKYALNIAMCIEGKKVKSTDLAKTINEAFIYHPEINFVVGASNGLTDTVKNACQMQMSFGDITMPHGLFRVVLLEQIYRSFKINNDESYHK